MRKRSARISFGTMCRGQGKIFVLLETQGLGPSCVLSSRAVVRGGEEVPSRIVTLETGESVLVLAVLQSTQTVTVSASTPSGSVVCSTTKNVGRRMAKLNSQVRTFMEDPALAWVRNCDEPFRPGEMNLVKARVSMGFPEWPFIVQATFCYPLSEGEDPHAPLSVRAYHPSAEAYGASEVRVLGDFVHKHPRLPGVLCRYIVVSVHVSAGERAVSLWLRALGEVPHVGLKCFEDFEVDDLRADWVRETTPNEECRGYEDWFLSQRASQAELSLQRQSWESMAQRPLFSVIVPLYHTPLDFFARMADSVLGQSYPNLELVLVNSTPEDAELREAVEHLAKEDDRVRVVTLQGNLGITENTNAGIDVAQGDFLAFFDHDDLLEPDLFYWYAKEIEREPRTDMLYCDEDKYEEGHYTYPFFKPDWSPLYLETNNYVCHLLTVRKEVLERLPRATKEFDGAQDHRLSLLAGAEARHVAHVRRVLYHWRIHAQSTAANANAKPETLEAGRKAVATSLQRRGIRAHAEANEKMLHCYNVLYDDLDDCAVSAIVLNDGSQEELERCLRSLRDKTSWKNLEVLVTDDLKDASWEVAAAINAAAAKASGNYLAVVSSRVYATDPGWVEAFLSVTARPDVGVVGGRVDYADGTKAEGSIILPCGGWNYAHRFMERGFGGSRSLEELTHESLAVSGSCLVMKTDVFRAVGGVTAGTNDFSWSLDLCLKVHERNLSIVERPGGMFARYMRACDLNLSHDSEQLRRAAGLAWLRAHWSAVFGSPDPYYSEHLGGSGYYDLVDENRNPAVPLGSERHDRHDDDGVFVCVDHIIRGIEEDVVRCFATFTAKDRKDIDGPVEIQTSGEEGELVTSAWVCMGDSTYELEGMKGFARKVAFSLRVPVELRSFSVVVRLGQQGVEGRACANEERVADLRERWRVNTLPPDQDPRYDDWFRTVHRMSPCELEVQREMSSRRVVRPVFSIIVPLYHTPASFLHEMAESVLAQTYPYLQLVLVNASPEDGELRRAVSKYVTTDERVTEVRLKQNLGITENTNMGIHQATGDFLAFLDHDDVLEPDALYWYAQAINERPTTDLLYCDEDHLIDGSYALPFFKTDWDLDRLRTENYVCHFLAVRKSVVDAFEMLPGREMDGSQDHNMTLLVGERARSVYHVPRVLYHWRAHENSTAGSQGTQQKSYALEAERLAVQNHLDRCGETATAVMGARRETRVDVQHRFETQPLVSIVIPNKDMAPVLERCVSSILGRSTWKNFELVIVENGSTQQETFALYDRLAATDARVRVVECVPKDGFNFSELINCGFEAAGGEYLLMLNNDTEVLTPDWIEQMMGICQRKDVGCVGAKLLYPDDTFQHMGVFVGQHIGPTHINTGLPTEDPGYYEINVLPHRVRAVTGACLLTKRSIWRKVGRLDEGLPVDYNDIDYCLKVERVGMAVVIQTNAVLRHYESVSRGIDKTGQRAVGFTKSTGVFGERWNEVLLGNDPYFSPSFRFNSIFYRLDTE